MPPVSICQRHAPWMAGAGLLILAMMVCGQQLRYPEWFASIFDDYIRYPYLLQAFKDDFLSGALYPRWMYALYGGYGYPTFLLYQPGYWFFSLPFALLADSPVLAAKLSNLACLLLLLAGIYRVFRHRGAGRVQAYAGLMLLMLYHNLFAGAAFSSIGSSMRYGYMFAVWGIYFGLRLCDAIHCRRPLGLAWGAWVLASACVLYTHPFVFGFYIAVMALLFAGQASVVPADERQTLLAIALYGLGTALALSAPYWFTVLTYSDKVQLAGAFEDNFTPEWQFKSKTLCRLYIGDCTVFWRSWLKFLLLAALVCASLLLARKQLFFKLVAIGYIVILVLLHPVSEGIWQVLPPLRLLQFPQRLFWLRNLLDIFIIAEILRRIPYGKTLKIMAGVMGVGVLMMFKPWAQVALHQDIPSSGNSSSYPYRIDYARLKQSLEQNMLLSFQGSNEFLPLGGQKEGIQNRYRHGIPVIEKVGMASKKEYGFASSSPGLSVPCSTSLNRRRFPCICVSINFIFRAGM